MGLLSTMIRLCKAARKDELGYKSGTYIIFNESRRLQEGDDELLLWFNIIVLSSGGSRMAQSGWPSSFSLAAAAIGSSAGTSLSLAQLPQLRMRHDAGAKL